MAAASCEAREMFLTNHALVLASLAGDPGLRLRDIADRVGVTERAVESIVRDLTAGGYLTKVRTGRRNRYRLHLDRPFQHPLVSHRSLSRLVQALVPDWDGHATPAASSAEEAAPAIPETRISCVQAESTLILHQTGQSRAEGDSVKRVLVYIAVATVMALATAAAAAAISRRSDPQPQPAPRHHVARQAAAAPALGQAGATAAPVVAAGPSQDAVRRSHTAPRHPRIAHKALHSRPVRGGAPAGDPPVRTPPPPVSTGTTVTVGTAGVGTTVTAGSGGVTATVGSPVGGVGVTLGAPAKGGLPVLGITVGPPPVRERGSMHLLIAGGIVWACVGTPFACALGTVLRSAAGGEEARWRVLAIADAFLASTARAAEALGASAAAPSDRKAAMNGFVTHRHRAMMARVDLAALLGEWCDPVERATGVLAALGKLAGAWDDPGPPATRWAALEAGLLDSQTEFAKAVWGAVGETGARDRGRAPRIPRSCASPAEP